MALWALTTLALTLFMIACWIRYRFGDVGFQAIVTNLPIGGGRTVGNSSLAVEAVLVCVALPVLVVTLAAVVVRWRGRRADTPQPGRRGRRLKVMLPIAAFTTSVTVLLSVAGIPNYATAVWGGHSMAPYYVDPAPQAPQTKRNLITIYLESMENTFTDADLFGRNLLAPLDAATGDWEHYTGLQQYPGGGWTMAGLVSTQCGIPLKSEVLVPGVHPNVSGQEVRDYLPGLTCLGDVLADHGYTNTWLGGADPQFAGKDTFLTGHGYTTVRGKQDWLAAGENPKDMSVWGLSDARLMANAKDIVDELHSAEQPFHLSILTLDTHEPAGVFPGCRTADAEPMATAISCSMAAVANFLGHLSQQGYLDDTVVVLMGDHLKGTSGASAFKAEMAAADNRTLLLRVWSPDQIRFNRRSHADQFSMLATSLELLGFRLPQGRAGLGVSLIGQHDLTGSAVALPAKEYQRLVAAPSTELYQRFWGGGEG
ncbi:sulfatase-like hydrolase/transferase [Propionibacteriaceae bacterium Y2011]